MITTIVTVLASVGVGGIIASIVSGLFTKKKTGAEAAEIITRAASGVVTNLEKEMLRQREDLDELIQASREERQRHKEEMSHIARAGILEREAWREVLAQHVAWDSAAAVALNERDIKIGPVPPLMPSRHYIDSRTGLPID